MFTDTPLEDLARIRVPTLVLTGAEDGHNESAGALANALADGQYVVLPGDHGTAFHTPQFAAAIISFLEDGTTVGGTGTGEPGEA
jgi:pimeloyl-ACP methyl ester carboxylesterase